MRNVLDATASSPAGSGGDSTGAAQQEAGALRGAAGAQQLDAGALCAGAWAAAEPPQQASDVDGAKACGALAPAQHVSAVCNGSG